MASTGPRKASSRKRAPLLRHVLCPPATPPISASSLPNPSSRFRADEQDNEMSSTKARPPMCTHPYFGTVMVSEGRRESVNIFVSLIFIHLQPTSASRIGTHQLSTTPRRVLLDTGADFNLISFDAHVELDLIKQPYHGRVRSIGGYTELDWTVLLQWHFRSQSAGPPRAHRASFHVLPPSSNAKFDCILGRPWIEENWAEFIALVDLNRCIEVA